MEQTSSSSDQPPNSKTNRFPDLHSKLLWVRETLGSIEKSKTNSHLKFSYRTEEDYYNAIRPLLNEAGVMLYVGCNDPRPVDGYVYVTMTYTYVDVDNPESTFTTTAAGMGDLKDGTGVKKAMTGAARYHFQKMYLVGDGDDDEADVGKKEVTPSQQTSTRWSKVEVTGPRTDDEGTFFDVKSVTSGKSIIFPVGDGHDLDVPKALKQMGTNSIPGDTPYECMAEILISPGHQPKVLRFRSIQ